jgi:hypothetical protein
MISARISHKYLIKFGSRLVRPQLTSAVHFQKGYALRHNTYLHEGGRIFPHETDSVFLPPNWAIVEPRWLDLL